MRTWILQFWMAMIIAVLPFTLAVNAQDEEEEETDEITEETVEETSTDEYSGLLGEEEVEVVVVTGSRLKRTTFESIAPLQIINAEVSREAGMIDSADIVQGATQSSGQQIDLTYIGYVLDNGPSASTANLRGLSADRTLVLINGRRVAPAGVQGAPSSPDLNLIPGPLVLNYDFLLDGASSVYGSDAIAGVANVKLRKDFNGFELESYSQHADAYTDPTQTVSLTWGRNFDRGFIGLAGVYRTQPHVSLDDAPFTGECAKNVEIDQNGKIRTGDLWFKQRFGSDLGDCASGGVTNVLGGTPRAGTLYYTPGTSNGGWNNFSESHAYGVWFDADGDGWNEVNFGDYYANGKQNYSTLLPKFTRTNFMTYGEYTLEGDLNATPFFEILYGRRHSISDSGEPQLFPTMHYLSPRNPCNPAYGYGVDCGLAYDEFLNNPVTIAGIGAVFGCNVGTGGSCDQTGGQWGPGYVQPVVRIRGDRNINYTTVSQTRYVAGITSDLPWIEKGSFSGWSGELSYIHSSSIGINSLWGIRDDRLNISLGNYSSLGLPCLVDAGNPFGFDPSTMEPDALTGCVEVNIMAPSIWHSTLVGDFETEKERDYLFDKRSFDTRVKQDLYSAYVTGAVGQLPSSSINAGFGVEVRKDKIDSLPNRIAAKGLLFGYSSDQGATGSKTSKEVFGEIEFPLGAGDFLVRELVLNMSARITSDEYYGSHTTWSRKLGWRPFDNLLIRATQGTSYRSPNLRNLFLKSQTGFLNLFDPCLIPADAIDEMTGQYRPELDNREQIVLTNCVAQGVDPMIASNNGLNVYSTEVSSGGSLTLDPETSLSTSVGFVIEQPFTNAFHLSVGSSYYKIDVNNTIIEPSAGFIISDCYNSPNSNSPFCSRISRDSDPARPLFSIIDLGFINRDNEQVRGIDVNILFQDSVEIFGRPIAVNFDVVSHKLLERSTLYINPIAGDLADEFRSEWGFHRWKHRARLALDWDDLRVSWSTEVLSSLDTDPESVDEWDQAITGNSDTCSGPPDDVLCKDVGFTERYLNHSVSVAYRHDSFTVIAGVSNLFNAEPPLVDGTEVFSVNSRPYGGYGYDLLGRTTFFDFVYRFGAQQ